MSNEANVNIKPEDPQVTTAEAPAAEQPKPAEAATPGAEQPKPEGDRPAKTADGEPAAEEAKKEEGIWDAVCTHFSDNWDKYAIGGGALAVGFVLGYALAKKGSTEAAPAEA